jgi:glutamate synthase domain-containing protein 1
MGYTADLSNDFHETGTMSFFRDHDVKNLDAYIEFCLKYADTFYFMPENEKMANAELDENEAAFLKGLEPFKLKEEDGRTYYRCTKESVEMFKSALSRIVFLGRFNSAHFDRKDKEIACFIPHECEVHFCIDDDQKDWLESKGVSLSGPPETRADVS